jgi:hypothetical protein
MGFLIQRSKVGASCSLPLEEAEKATAILSAALIILEQEEDQDQNK